ncbi:MAG: oxidoreductase, partial [Acidobacteriota bacterium]|nr:oxidoreductase [Acidobacteriota bacterium]
KEPVVHTASHFDRVLPSPAGLQAGGVSFAGIRGIERVEVRADAGPWVTATLDQPLSPYTWTRWWARLPVDSATQVEARALDRTGRWQESIPGPLFPNGVSGPTVRSIGS